MLLNESTRSFLRYYCALQSPPQYAVLLTGAWGSGKTWFVKNLLRSIDPAAETHLYVSLYGVRSISDIEDEFFRQLHPLLASKGARVLGKLARGLVKTTVNIDLNADGKADGTLTAGVPTEALFRLSSPTTDRLLVFDDLERCSMSLVDLLGFINGFVEHGGYRAILIGNEAEILARETETNTATAYRRVKEKLIGRTFEIHAESGPALTHFISELPSALGREVIAREQESILSVYAAAGYKNLRLLRHALREFDRLCDGLDARILECEALLGELLDVFLTYSFEVRSGSLTAAELRGLRFSAFSTVGLRSGEPNPKQKYVDIRSKYPHLDLFSELVPLAIWEEVFTAGSIPVAELNAAQLQSKYFRDANTPLWVQYWHARDLTDGAFEGVQASVEHEWTERVYKDIGIVLHVAAMFLVYSKAGILARSPTDVLRDAREYIATLGSKGYLVPAADSRTGRLFDPESYGGLGYMAVDDPEFRDLLGFADEQSTCAAIARYPQLASELLETMRSDPDKFARMIVLSNHEDNRYHDVPLLVHLPPVEFVTSLLTLSPAARRTVLRSIKERYRFVDVNKGLVPELPWLQRVGELIDAEAEKRSGKLSGHQLREWREHSLSASIAGLSAVEV